MTAPHESAVELVRRTARLARLRVSPAEAERLGAEFARILDAFRVLEEVDVDGLEETSAQAVGTAELRADEHAPSLPRERLLAAAPRPHEGFYAVPRTVGGAP